jgi:8-oxo-dGTP diphosphatase
MLGEPMRTAQAAFRIVKEAARHVLRRPVVGVAVAARTREGRWLLIRRGDTGEWALPGGTLEWGESLRDGARREIEEETGAQVLELGELSGVYSDVARDPRFHAVTVLVHAVVGEPSRPPTNPLEIAEVRLFDERELPPSLSHAMTDMLEHARSGHLYWE